MHSLVSACVESVLLSDHGDKWMCDVRNQRLTIIGLNFMNVLVRWETIVVHNREAPIGAMDDGACRHHHARTTRMLLHPLNKSQSTEQTQLSWQFTGNISGQNCVRHPSQAHE